MSCYSMGKMYLDMEEYQLARGCFEKGIEEGDVKCYYGIYATDMMTASDETESLERLCSVFEELIKKDSDPDVCFILGRCYETGSCVSRDLHSAMMFYSKGGKLGNMDSVFNLGCIFMSLGEYESGEEYFKRAAQKGHYHAQRALKHYLENKQKR